jgi:hypothetical protein
VPIELPEEMPADSDEDEAERAENERLRQIEIDKRNHAARAGYLRSLAPNLKFAIELYFRKGACVDGVTLPACSTLAISPTRAQTLQMVDDTYLLERCLLATYSSFYERASKEQVLSAENDWVALSGGMLDSARWTLRTEEPLPAEKVPVVPVAVVTPHIKCL